jgi:hypothetical protein
MRIILFSSLTIVNEWFTKGIIHEHSDSMTGMCRVTQPLLVQTEKSPAKLKILYTALIETLQLQD